MKRIFIAIIIIITIAACSKDDYYKDGGLQKPAFDGSTLAYLDAVPLYFDSLAAIVRLAGMEQVFTSDTLTFFAPTDRSILHLIKDVNSSLYVLGYDTLKTLSDVPQQVWQKYLQRYMFHGANQLKDYPQIDFSLRSIYPGQDYLSWNGSPMNIGVVFNDDNGVKYVGYRQLTLSFIPNPAHPLDNWITAFVASSNVTTLNGVVHTLDKNHYYFGFDMSAFIDDLKAIQGNPGGRKK